MEKFMALLEQKLVPIASKVSGNSYLKAISSGSMSLIGIIMVGAVFTVLSSITWTPYNNFMAAYQLDTFIAFVPAVTTNLLAVYMAFAIGYRGASCFSNEKYAMSSGLLALVNFMLLTPIDTTSLDGISFINVQYLGTRGVFTSMVIAVITAKLLAVIIHKNIKIKMPEGVPPMVSESFSALIANTIIVTIFLIVKVAFSMTEFGTFNDFIYLMLQTPLQALTGNLSAFLICLTLAQVLWFFGVHGSMTVLPLLMPIWFGYMGANTASVAVGEGVVHPLNVAMWDLASLGGAGATIGLIILMAFFSKSQQYKQLGKLTLPCGIVNISEPIIFGIPIILNPLMFIPFILCPIVIVTLGYFLIQIGIVTAPLGIFGFAAMPPFISGIMQGSLSFAIYQLVAVVISVVIYFPFFKILDKQALANERGVNNEE